MKTLRIKEIVKTISDTHPFDLDYLYAVNTSDVENGYLVNPPLLPTDELKGQFKKTIKQNDILFSEIRPQNRRFARVYFSDTKQYVCSTKLMVLRKYNDDVDLDYFYYAITNDNFLHILQRRAENRIGSFPQITFDILGEYSIPIPSIDEQKKIANTIKIIDDKIALNNKTTTELENMAKTIYDYWFTQFDFPDKNGHPYKTSGGQMVYNEILKREIPAGWEVKILGDVCEIVLGGTPSTDKDEYWNGNIPWLNSGEVAEFPIINAEKTVTELGIKDSATELVPAGTVTLSITRHLRPSILTMDACINQSVVGIKENEIFSKNFLYPFIASKINHYMMLRTGAQQPHINKETVDDTLVCIPSAEVLENYNKEVESIYERIILNAKETKQLTELRDYLLPLLMNGQIEVK